MNPKKKEEGTINLYSLTFLTLRSEYIFPCCTRTLISHSTKKKKNVLSNDKISLNVQWQYHKPFSPLSFILPCRKHTKCFSSKLIFKFSIYITGVYNIPIAGYIFKKVYILFIYCGSSLPVSITVIKTSSFIRKFIITPNEKPMCR